jgi:MoxR-like ATPase
MAKNTSEAWEHVQERTAALRKEIANVIVGQEAVIEEMLVALLCKGHCLIVGVPGLAKTLLVSTLGKILGLSFHRIQFTPDLMPMDIIGSEILQDSVDGKNRKFEFSKGPIFANLILADEINRTPPKTQAALLEAMQEKQVTVAGNTMPLDEPFIVYATQNPIEHEGTYPLPEAQLDRFFFNLLIDYPTMKEERDIVLRTTGREEMEVKTVLPAREDSYESLFHASGVPGLLLGLRDSPAPELREALSESRLERAIGVIYRPETELASHYFRAVLPRQFDEFVWLDDTRAVEPIETRTLEGVPDTYPFGL